MKPTNSSAFCISIRKMLFSISKSIELNTFIYKKTGFSQRLGGVKKNHPTLHPSTLLTAGRGDPTHRAELAGSSGQCFTEIIAAGTTSRDATEILHGPQNGATARRGGADLGVECPRWIMAIWSFPRGFASHLEGKGKWNMFTWTMAVGSWGRDFLFFFGLVWFFMLVDCLGGRIELLIGNIWCIILDVKSEIFWSSGKAAASLNKNPENFRDFEACKIQKRDMQLFLSQMSDQPKPQASVQSSGPKGDGRKWDRTASKSSDSTEGGVWRKWHLAKNTTRLGSLKLSVLTSPKKHVWEKPTKYRYLYPI